MSSFDSGAAPVYKKPEDPSKPTKKMRIQEPYESSKFNSYLNGGKGHGVRVSRRDNEQVRYYDHDRQRSKSKGLPEGIRNMHES